MWNNLKVNKNRYNNGNFLMKLPFFFIVLDKLFNLMCLTCLIVYT